MLDKNLCREKKKDLNYYQDRITKVINEIKKSDRKYTIDDFPMKLNMSIIGDEDVLSNIIIDKDFSLLRKESEVYIYPTEMKELLEDKIREKEEILHKNNFLETKEGGVSFTFFAICLIVLIMEGMFVFPKSGLESIVDKVLFLGTSNIFIMSGITLIFLEKMDNPILLDIFLLILSFLISPILPIIYMIVFAIETIKEIRKANNYGEEDMKSDLNELVKDLPQSVQNIIFAKKVSFY